MTDEKQIIEGMARAMREAPSVWVNTIQSGSDLTYEVCLWTLKAPGDFEVLEDGFRTLYDAEKAIMVWVSRLRARAAFAVCKAALAPAPVQAGMVSEGDAVIYIGDAHPYFKGDRGRVTRKGTPPFVYFLPDCGSCAVLVPSDDLSPAAIPGDRK